MENASNSVLATVLHRLAEELETCRDPWCIFGGASMVLRGLENGPIRDVDVLVSLHDARAIMDRLALPNLAAGGTSLFRSKVLLHADFGPLPVEIMADMQICHDGQWHAVTPGEPDMIRFGGINIPIARILDQMRISHLSGREKDVRRGKLLREMANRTSQQD